MDKENIVIVSIVSFLVIVFVFVFYLPVGVDDGLNDGSNLDLGVVESDVGDDVVDDDGSFASDEIYLDAVLEGNLDSCYNISDSVVKERCLVNANNSKNIADVVMVDDVDLCDERFADDESFIQICRDNYYVSKAYNSGDKSYCDSVINEVVRNGCME